MCNLNESLHLKGFEGQAHETPIVWGVTLYAYKWVTVVEPL